jgi:hypothetical protein
MWTISCTEYYLYANGHTYKALLSINYKMVVGYGLVLHQHSFTFGWLLDDL